MRKLSIKASSNYSNVKGQTYYSLFCSLQQIDNCLKIRVHDKEKKFMCIRCGKNFFDKVSFYCLIISFLYTHDFAWNKTWSELKKKFIECERTLKLLLIPSEQPVANFCPFLKICHFDKNKNIFSKPYWTTENFMNPAMERKGFNVR